MYIHYCRKIAIFLCYYELQITVSQNRNVRATYTVILYIYIFIYNIKFCTYFFKLKFAYCNL